MRYKLSLALILALSALALPTAAVRPSAAQTGLAVGVYCEIIAGGRQVCQADVSGGTPPYTYQWGPPPLTGSGQFKVVPCAGHGLRPLSVTVTDANGLTGGFSGQLQCCSSCDPQ